MAGSLSFLDARRLVDEAEALLLELEDRLSRCSADYDGDDPYNDWWADKLEDLVVMADRRVRRRRELLKGCV
jgi:hypothetical protein